MTTLTKYPAETKIFEMDFRNTPQILAGESIAAVTAIRAKAIGQLGGVDLSLEVGGVIQPVPLTLSSGAGEQTDEYSLSVAIPANTVIRWKCTSRSGAILIGVTMNVTS